MSVGIVEAFRRHKVELKNWRYSVSSWADANTLVVSLWDHHRVKNYGPRVLAYADRFDRWTGPGNAEFRKNVTRAFTEGAAVRLVIARTLETDRVERGEDASKIRKKTYTAKLDVVGRVVAIDGENYMIEFRWSD